MKKCVLAIVLTALLICMPIVCCAEGESRDFTVTYYVGDEITEIRTYQEGAMISAPMISCAKGYAVTSWRTAGGEAYDFSSPISAPLSLYAEVSLLPAVATVDALSFEYDGEPHALKIATVYHPLDSAGGYYKFEWYRDGVLLSETASLDVKNVSDSGNYSLKISFFYEDSSSAMIYDGISVNVHPKRITPPVIDDVAYENGDLVTPTLKPSPYYTYAPVFVKGVGSYLLELTLTDKENYRWDDRDGESILVGFNVIEKREDAEAGGEPSGEYGENKNFSIVAVLFLFSLLLAAASLVLIIVARKNTRIIAASVSAPNKKPILDIDAEDHSDDGQGLSIQLSEDDTSDGEYRELTRTDALRADCLISDSLAKNMIRSAVDDSPDTPQLRATVSIGEISNGFYANERVDINSLKARKIIESDVGFVRITEDGEIDKPLKVYASDFSITAVKMIVLTGGEVYKYKNKRF